MSRHEIRERLDIYQVRRALKLIATKIGFAPRACNELAIVASELTSNILKYGVRGSLNIEAIGPPNERGVMLVARDYGRPFHDLAMALQDGCDDRGPIDPMLMLKRGGIGGGLGAVLRLSHSFRVNALDDGKAIEVIRYLTRPLENPSIVLKK